MMNAFVTARNGKAERFTVEVLAVPGAGGNPDFSVRITHPNGEVYSQIRDHQNASDLFHKMLDAARAEVFSPDNHQDEAKPGCFGAIGLIGKRNDPECPCRWKDRCRQAQVDY